MNPNQFCDVTWPLLPSSPISLLLIVVIFFLLILQSAAYHASPFALPLSVLSLLISCLWPPPVCAKNPSVGLVVAYSSHICCSPRIIDSSMTAMTRLLGNLLNNGGKTAMLAHQQSPLIWWHDLLDNDNGGASAITSNFWQQQTAPQWLRKDCNIGTSAISFNLATQPPWQWWWRCIKYLLEFLTAVTLQCQRIGKLLDSNGVQHIGELLDSMLFVAK